MKNVGNIAKSGYDWYRDNQNRYERDMLAASLVPQNEWFANYYGISDYDPKTGLIKKGFNKGKYVDINDPNNGKYYEKPFLATPGIVATVANGGKLKRNKKRKGFTF